MKRVNRLWCTIFLFTLLIPGYALGTATFTFDHPASVRVNDTFQVTVYLSDDNASHTINAYSYCFDYDQSALQLVPQDIACTYDSPCDPGDIFCIALPPVDGNFFGGTCPGCRAYYHPLASNFVPSPPSPPPLASIEFQDAGDLIADDDTLSCPCAVHGAYDRKLVSTYTFKALRETTTEFDINLLCTQVVSCDGNPSTPEIVSPPIIIGPAVAVPTFSGSGIAFFALVIAISFFLVVRKFRKSLSRSSALSFLLVLGITLSVGTLWSEISHALPICPEECMHLNLDVNRSGDINVADSYILHRCLKLNSCDPATMDVDGDGSVNWDDYRILVQCIHKGCVKPE